MADKSSKREEEKERRCRKKERKKIDNRNEIHCQMIYQMTLQNLVLLLLGSFSRRPRAADLEEYFPN